MPTRQAPPEVLVKAACTIRRHHHYVAGRPIGMRGRHRVAYRLSDCGVLPISGMRGATGASA